MTDEEISITVKSQAGAVRAKLVKRVPVINKNYYRIGIDIFDGRARELLMDDEDLNQVIHKLVDLHNEGKSPHRRLKIFHQQPLDGMSPCCDAVLWTLPYEGQFECFKCGKRYEGPLHDLKEAQS